MIPQSQLKPHEVGLTTLLMLCISTTAQRLFIFLGLHPKENRPELKHAKECMCLGRTYVFTRKVPLNQLMLLGNRNLELWDKITGTNRKI